MSARPVKLGISSSHLCCALSAKAPGLSASSASHLYEALISNLLTMSFLFFKKPRQDIVNFWPTYKKKFHLFLIMELIDRTAIMGSSFGLERLPVLVQKSISSTQPLFVLFYSVIGRKFFGFKEKTDHKIIIKKVICFAAIIIGVLVVLSG